MRRGHVPMKVYQDRRTKRRREEVKRLAAERAAWAVELAVERTRRAHHQALARELEREREKTQEGLQPSSSRAPESLPSPSHLSHCTTLKAMTLTNPY